MEQVLLSLRPSGPELLHAKLLQIGVSVQLRPQSL